MHDIAQALIQVRERIAAAAARAGRAEGDITLVAVSKTRSVDEINQAIQAGAQHLGENYVQEMIDKFDALGYGAQGRLQWHAIGHLQTNKVRQIAGFCGMVHSLDSTRLADEISRRAQQAGRTQPVLVEVNVAEEESKFGLDADQVAPFADYVARLPHIQLRGLMCMTPFGADEGTARRCFANLRRLSGQLAPALPDGAMSDLSMGMTQDFEIAVEEGATLVRVGTAIFGERRHA